MRKFSILSLIVFSVGVGSLLVGPAFGHASLLESNVNNGQVFSLSDAPGHIKLKFSETLETKRSTIYVVKVGEEAIVDKGDLFIHDDEMTINISVLATGVYQIHAIAVTADDGGFRHDVITFSVKI